MVERRSPKPHVGGSSPSWPASRRVEICGAKPMKDFFDKLRNKFRNIIDFLKDTRKELNNVSWPGRREVTGTTVVVIASVFFFGFFLFIIDIIVSNGMNYIERALSARP
jgi:preprotein translocase subunit SecE